MTGGGADPHSDVTMPSVSPDPIAAPRGAPWVRHSSSSSRRPRPRTISGMLGPDFIVESSVGHIRDLPRGADEVPAAYKGESWARLGVDVDNGFKPLYVVSSTEEVGGGQAQEAAEGRRRALPRDRRGPRGRVDRVAPLRGARRRRCRSSAWSSTRSRPAAIAARRRGVARARPPAGRRPGGPADPRPPLRLRGVAGAVAQGHAAALGRAGPERGHPDGRRARAGAHAVPLGHLVGRRGHLHPRRHAAGRLRRDPGRPGRRRRRHRQGLRRARGADGQGDVRSSARRRRPRSRRALAGRPFTGQRRHREARSAAPRRRRS